MKNQQEQPIQEVPDQTPVEQPAEANKTSILRSKWLKIGGILLVLLLLLGGAYFLGKSSSKPTPLGSPKPTAKAATPTPNPTANWKTYMNTKYGYSLRFPSDLHPADYLNSSSQDPEQADALLLSTCSAGDTICIGSSGGGPLLIQAVKNKNNLSLSEEIRSNYPTAVEIKDFTVDNTQGTRFVQPAGGNILIPSDNVILLKNSYFFTFNLGTNKKIDLKLFDQILSTFKFTSPTVATPTPNSAANWKTYTNPRLGLSFKYPSDWSIKTPWLIASTSDFPIGLNPPVKENGDAAPPIMIEQYDNPKNLSIKDWQDDYNQGKPSETRFYSSADTTTTIAGFTAYTNDKADTCEPFYCHTALIMAKNNIFVFRKVDFDKYIFTPEQLSKNQQVFDQIIPTIKISQ